MTEQSNHFGANNAITGSDIVGKRIFPFSFYLRSQRHSIITLEINTTTILVALKLIYFNTFDMQNLKVQTLLKRS